MMSMLEKLREFFEYSPILEYTRQTHCRNGLWSLLLLKHFLSSSSIVTNMSPKTIRTGQTVDFNKHYKYNFREHIHTHEQYDNIMISRTVATLALQLTGNKQEKHFFWSLFTREQLNWKDTKLFPMPSEIVM